MFRKLIFNLWYLKSPPWDTRISPPELLNYLARNPQGSALDLGCGTGTNAITLAQHGWKTTAVDFAPRAIRIARKRAEQAGLDIVFIVDDATTLNKIADRFELILDIGCFHGLTPAGKERYIANLERIIAQDGTLLMYAFLSQPEEKGIGLLPADLERLSSILQLEHRQDGTERGIRSSAWLTFRNKIE